MVVLMRRGVNLGRMGKKKKALGLALTSHADGTIVWGTTTLTATPAGGVQPYVGVQFFLNPGNIDLGTDTTAPYSIAWDTTTVPDGNYTLSVGVYDANFTSATTSINITVDNVGGAAWMGSEANGVAIDFTCAQDAKRVAKKTAGVLAEQGIDSFITNAAAASPKMVYNSAGILGWSPHNILPGSEAFDSGSWVKGNITATANAIAAPNGTVTADKLGRSLATSGSFSFFTGNLTILNGETYTFKIWLKAGEINWVSIDHLNFDTTKTYFNLGAGTIGTISAAHKATMTADSGGYWCTITWTSVTANTLCTVTFRDGNDAGPSISAGTIGDGVYAWGAQLNRGAVPTGYVSTVAALRTGVPIDYDPITHQCRGMMTEPAATNSVVWSTDLTNVIWYWFAGVAPGAAIAPNGRWEGTKIGYLKDPDPLYAGFMAGFNNTAGAITGRLSIFAKAIPGECNQIALYTGANIAVGFDLLTGTPFQLLSEGAPEPMGTNPLMENCGNGWWRCSADSVALTDVNISFCRDYEQVLINPEPPQGWGCYLWGPQLEATNTLTTSYVPTFAATATRATDNITALTSSWVWNAAGPNSIVFEAAMKQITAMGYLTLHDGTDAERIVFDTSTATKIVRMNVIDANVVGTDMPGTLLTPVANTYYKVAAAVALNDCAISYGGILPSGTFLDPAATMPTVTTLQLGGSRTTPGRNMYIKNIKIVPRRMTNVELQTATT